MLFSLNLSIIAKTSLIFIETSSQIGLRELF